MKEKIETWFNLPDKTKKDIFNQVSSKTGLLSTAIEKDWWATLTLRTVFKLPFSEFMIFKGGTSLSKGWNLIERFSEDIDLSIDHTFLGYKKELTRKQIKKLRKDSYSFVVKDFIKALDNILSEMNIPVTGINPQEVLYTDTDPSIIELHYFSLYEKSSYVQPRVLIEIGARSIMEPYENRMIQSFVEQQFGDKDFADLPVSIPTVLPKRTFLEKAFLLHEEFHRPSKKMRVERMSRHLYDLEKLMDTEHGISALKDMELYQSIVDHRKMFFPISGIDYSNHNPGEIDFVPPDGIRDEWEKDYKIMQETMVYGKSLDFDLLLERLRELRDRFRSIQ